MNGSLLTQIVSKKATEINNVSRNNFTFNKAIFVATAMELSCISQPALLQFQYLASRSRAAPETPSAVPEAGRFWCKIDIQIYLIPVRLPIRQLLRSDQTPDPKPCLCISTVDSI